LNDVSVFQLAADTARATGMTVYNTNPAIGAGLYIWDGKKWKQIGAGVSTGCNEAPEVPGAISFSATSVDTNVPFTAGVPAVTGNNAPTSYTWHLPDGLTGTSTDRIITITATTAKTYDAGTITVTATNDCDVSAEQSSTTAVVVTQAVGPGEPIVVGNNTYATYCYPGTVGCWMIQNSKEGTPSSKQYDDKPEGARGYYYSWNLALGACPTGWSVPSLEQWSALTTYINGPTEPNEKAHWFGEESMGGYIRENYSEWGDVGEWWSADNNNEAFIAVSTTGLMRKNNGLSALSKIWLSVRCIKK
jgi:uncharacterized protein (TIGR02145 family)